jgi:hypothetical protein
MDVPSADGFSVAENRATGRTKLRPHGVEMLAFNAADIALSFPFV